MPLISSPIDGSPMREIERYGVKIDICQTSGGIWLDKGELEKIILMIRNEALEEARAQSPQPTPPPAQAYQPQQPQYQQPTMQPQGYAQQHQYHAPHGKKKKRESMFENLMDIFDM